MCTVCLCEYPAEHWTRLLLQGGGTAVFEVPDVEAWVSEMSGVLEGAHYAEISGTMG